MGKMRFLDKFAYSLLVIGGLNWGLVGFFDFNLVEWLDFGTGFIGMFIYALVFLSAVYGGLQLPKLLK